MNDMNIPFAGKFTREDAGVIYYLLGRKRSKDGRFILNFYTGMPILGVLLEILGIIALLIGYISWVSLILIWISFVLILISIRGNSKIKKQLEESFEKMPMMDGFIDKNGISVKTELSETALKWEAIHSYGKQKDYILFFQEQAMVLGLKRDYFSSNEDWEKAKNIIESNVSQVIAFRDSDRKVPWKQILPIVIVILFMILIILQRQ